MHTLVTPGCLLRLLGIGWCLLAIGCASLPRYTVRRTVAKRPVQAASVAAPGLPPMILAPPPVPAPPLPPSPPPDPLQTIRDANDRARYEPTAEAFAQGLLVFAYHPGGVYRLYTAPGRLTDLQLQAGERLLAVTGADTERWKIEESASGVGASSRVHLLVKPLHAGLTTTMVVTTSKRAYHLEVTSRETTALLVVAWRYPDEEATAADPLRAVLSPTAVRHAAYTIRARATPSPSWMPLEVFDNAEKTFIRFPATLKTGEAPVLYIVSPRGELQLVNYHPRGLYYIVDRLFTKAELRVGEGKHSVVTIERREGTPETEERRPWEDNRDASRG